MIINETKQGEIKIVQPIGKMDAAGAPELDQYLVRLIESGTPKLIIDLARIDYVSSAGLRVFLAAAKKMQPLKGKILLAAPTAQVQQIFDIAGFSSILTIVPTLNEAIAACA